MDAVATSLRHGDETLLLDPLGVLWLPARATLVVADLHLEKGSAFARRGTLLPPYDTARTLRRLGWAIERYRPQTVVSLGDAFHDRAGAAALTAADREQLQALARGRDWLWVRGNHDPDPPAGLAGDSVDHLEIGRLRLVHLPENGGGDGPRRDRRPPPPQGAARPRREEGHPPLLRRRFRGSCCCRPSAPTRAASTSSTRPSRTCSQPRSPPSCWARRGSSRWHTTISAPTRRIGAATA